MCTSFKQESLLIIILSLVVGPIQLDKELSVTDDNEVLQETFELLCCNGSFGLHTDQLFISCSHLTLQDSYFDILVVGLLLVLGKPDPSLRQLILKDLGLTLIAVKL